MVLCILELMLDKFLCNLVLVMSPIEVGNTLHIYFLRVHRMVLSSVLFLIDS